MFKHITLSLNSIIKLAYNTFTCIGETKWLRGGIDNLYIKEKEMTKQL